MNPINSFTKKVSTALGSRLALNAYFWIILIVTKLPDADDHSVYSPFFYYLVILFYMIFFAVLSYVNNFIFLPKLLFKNKKIVYFVAAFFFLFLIAFCYTFTLKKMQSIYPGLDLEMSIVMSPISGDISLASILSDMQSYFAVMCIWLIIFSLGGIYHENIKKIKSMEAEIISNREAEITFLKNQINPHFLFNTLNNLYALTLKKSDEAPTFIIKLSAILRYILYESSGINVNFEKEKEIIQAYIDIELLRIKQNNTKQFLIKSDHSSEIPPLLWLPVLENVFVHNRMVDLLIIQFEFILENRVLTLFCKNNISENKVRNTEKKVGGIGLSNLKKRLDLLFPNNHTFSILNDEKSFIIDIKIKLD